MNQAGTDILKNLSVDCVIFGFKKQQLNVMLIKLNVEPGKGEWALPGGNILLDEDLDEAARRVLYELTSVENLYMEQLYSFGDVDRFQLFRVITIAYYALVKPEKYKLFPGPKASDVKWFNLSEIPLLPFDHDNILQEALKQLRKNIRYNPIGFELLPKKFTLTELQSLYECILNRELDKRNFRKKILSMNLLEKLDEKQMDVAHRRPHLYRFDKKNYQRLKQSGFNFEL
ncbi:MAG: NUDIX hydrolase [Calditrichaeota bacterium]|nr:NUDIX hydrolase [Calditrichota bacterium]